MLIKGKRALVGGRIEKLRCLSFLARLFKAISRTNQNVFLIFSGEKRNPDRQVLDEAHGDGDVRVAGNGCRCGCGAGVMIAIDLVNFPCRTRSRCNEYIDLVFLQRGINALGASKALKRGQ